MAKVEMAKNTNLEMQNDNTFYYWKLFDYSFLCFSLGFDQSKEINIAKVSSKDLKKLRHFLTVQLFLANPHFILQISHAKTFKIKYTRCPYNNIIQNIHKVTKTDYVWFEILWIRRYLHFADSGPLSFFRMLV